MSSLCFCREPCGQVFCLSRIESLLAAPAQSANPRCSDCDAEYFGTVEEAIGSDWVMMSAALTDVLCPDCFDALANFETESSATGYEAPEWSKNEDPAT